MHIPVCIPPVAVIMNMMKDHSYHPDEDYRKCTEEMDDEIVRLRAETTDKEPVPQPEPALASTEHIKHEIRGNALKYRTLLEFLAMRPDQHNA